jgi:hypothetical protein
MKKISFIEKISFWLNKKNAAIFNISSHGILGEKPKIIYRDGSVYEFAGKSISDVFYIEIDSMSNVEGCTSFNKRPLKDVELDAIALLIKFGFSRVEFIKSLKELKGNIEITITK